MASGYPKARIHSSGFGYDLLSSLGTTICYPKRTTYGSPGRLIFFAVLGSGASLLLPEPGSTAAAGAGAEEADSVDGVDTLYFLKAPKESYLDLEP